MGTRHTPRTPTSDFQYISLRMYSHGVVFRFPQALPFPGSPLLSCATHSFGLQYTTHFLIIRPLIPCFAFEAYRKIPVGHGHHCFLRAPGEACTSASRDPQSNVIVVPIACQMSRSLWKQFLVYSPLTLCPPSFWAQWLARGRGSNAEMENEFHARENSISEWNAAINFEWG